MLLFRSWLKTKSSQQVIGQLLEVSVQLTEPVSIALSKLDAEEHGKSIDGLLQDMFDKEVALLQQWKEKYGPRIDKRLTSRNPAQLEAIAENIFNIADLLSLSPSHPSTHLS